MSRGQGPAGTLGSMSRMPLRTRLFGAVYDRLRRESVAGLDLAEIQKLRDSVAPTRRPWTWVTGPVPAGVHITRASFVARDGHGIRVRVYRPASAGPHPVVVFLHGGGWVLGDPRGYDPLSGFIADSVPALVLSVDYRRAPEDPAPQAVLDSVDAVRWATRTAAGLGGDPVRLAVCGDSAGGNLAAVACRVIRDEDGPRIAHQALLYPGTDATQSFPSVREHAHAPILTLAAINAYLELYVGRSHLAPDDPLVSPIWADDLSGLPPALIQTADLDPLRDEGQAYAAQLAAAGVPVRATNYLGTPHGFMSFPGATVCGPQARLELATELSRHLGAVSVLGAGSAVPRKRASS